MDSWIKMIRTHLLLVLFVSSVLTDNENGRYRDYDELQDNDWNSFESLLVEESVLPNFVSNSSSVAEFRCPAKCLCFESTVRCMMLSWEETNRFELVPSSTSML